MALDVRRLSDADLERAASALHVLVPHVFEKAESRRKAEAHRTNLALQPTINASAAKIRSLYARTFKAMRSTFERSKGNIPRTIAAGKQIFAREFPRLHKEILTSAMRHGWERAEGQIQHRVGKAKARKPVGQGVVNFDVAHPGIGDYIQARVRRYSPAIAQDSIDDIRDILESGAAEGASMQEVTQDIFDRALPEMSQGRAMRIARTESGAASNAAANAAYQASGVVEMKQWLSAGDDKVRELHEGLDGEVVNVDEPFVDDDGNEMMYPGDDTMDAELDTLINCRCAVAPYIPDIPESGEKSVDGEPFAKYEGQPRDDHGRFGEGQQERTDHTINVRTTRTISPELQRIAQRAVNRVTERYPIVSSTLRNVEFAQVASGRPLADTTVGAYYYHEQTLTLNAHVWSDPKILAWAHDESGETKGFSAVATPAGTIYHELGHALENAIGQQDRETLNAFHVAHDALMAESSKYAHAGSHEAFAETFAALMAGRSTPATHILEKALKRWAA
jgi:SPP1 gp7 family putative phage head morphogenesis protein